MMLKNQEKNYQNSKQGSVIGEEVDDEENQ